MTPAAQLERFVDAFTPAIAARTRAVLAAMRRRLPGAIQLVYDNFNALAIAFAPTERAGDAIFSIAVYPRWVSLFFAQGARLPDPKKRLRGNGNQMRHIVLDDEAVLDEPAVRALMKAALKLAGDPLDPDAPGRVVIKSVAAKRRPRRPGG